MSGSSALRTTPTIAVGIESAANVRLINSVVGDQYSLQHALDGAAWEEPELIVVDRASLQRHSALIHQLCTQDAPMILPVLLVSDGRRDPNLRSHAELGTAINDILRIPTSRMELLARIDNLVHMRQLSRTQEKARRELSDVVGALQILNACDQILVRSESESALLDSICHRIVQAEDYDLAWISFPPLPDIPAKAGKSAEYTNILAAEWASTNGHRALVKEALETGKPQPVQHLQDEGLIPEAFGNADERTLSSGVVLPLQVDIGTPGYLAICSHYPNHFDQEECQLLQRLSTNLAYALNTHRFQRERDIQSAEIRGLAFSDALTGLPNRHYLTSFLDDLLENQETRGAPSAAILFIDLDGFKIINDALGHDAGDEVLIQVSRRLQGAVRDSDLVVRQGGDEFLVVIFDAPRTSAPLKPRDPDSFKELASSLACRIIDSLNSPFVVDDHEQHLSASIGISLCPDHGENASVIIQAADIAMYEAKKTGGISHLYSPAISEQRQQRLSLENRLRHAIDHEELALHFQPLFNMQTLDVIGTEALVRWPQEDGSMLSPGNFIPLAEETCLIRPMGDWILEAAARQLRDWHDAGYPLTMSVNLSLKQLQSEGDVERFFELVRPYIDPRWITLELTESIVASDPSAIESLMHKLSEHGFQIAIDDFGTGYSSLSRLQHMPIQILKIDRSFVDQINTPGKGNAMIPIIRQMAASFGLLTVAEGIENEAQYQHLCKQGVDVGQGFWFGRPVPEAQLREMFLQGATIVPPQM
ncbi:diguanylate cyclase (GGDEF)-like protein [Halospina denitrificans]|uniref:Diguanylate cyclase (GGDEF)-like protein n=1 Tax=Halospina denitrificans TaxID=332522 RepID=A0A4R7JQ29_9GAMM|nr:EAL domain-containing protein [Halospina denitrificans]TDT40282.1 diguanylate cyclase (GGDEF)-like protein [Halospina denitrificans]